MARSHRCRQTGRSCSYAYMYLDCKCRDCSAWQADRMATYNRRRRALRAPKVPTGKVLRSTDWRRPDPLPVPEVAPQLARASMPAGHTSAGLLASHGLGPAPGTTQRAKKTPGKATARTGQDVRALKWPPGRLPRMICGSCGHERQLAHRGEPLACCAGGLLQWTGEWTTVTFRRPPVARDALPEGTPTTKRKRGTSGTERGRSTNRPLDILRRRSLLEIITGH